MKIRKNSALIFFLSAIFFAAGLYLFFCEGKSDLKNSSSKNKNSYERVAFKKYGAGIADLKISDDGIFLALDNSRILKIDFTGNVLASLEVKDFKFSANLSILKNVLIISNVDSQVIAIDKNLKNVLWKFSAEDKVSGAFSELENGTMLFGSYDKNIYELNTQTGARIFTVATTEAINGGGATFKDLALFGNCAGELYCVDANLKVVAWSAEIGSYIPLSPIACGDFAIVATHGGELVGFNFTSGKELWRDSKMEVSANSQIVSSEKEFFFITSEGILKSARARDGKILRSLDLGEHRAILKYNDGKILAALKSGKVFIFDQDNFSEIFFENLTIPVDCVDFNFNYIAITDSDNAVHIFKRNE